MVTALRLLLGPLPDPVRGMWTLDGETLVIVGQAVFQINAAGAVRRIGALKPPSHRSYVQPRSRDKQD